MIMLMSWFDRNEPLVRSVSSNLSLKFDGYSLFKTLVMSLKVNRVLFDQSLH